MSSTFYANKLQSHNDETKYAGIHWNWLRLISPPTHMFHIVRPAADNDDFHFLFVVYISCHHDNSIVG